MRVTADGGETGDIIAVSLRITGTADEFVDLIDQLATACPSGPASLLTTGIASGAPVVEHDTRPRTDIARMLRFYADRLEQES